MVLFPNLALSLLRLWSNLWSKKSLKLNYWRFSLFLLIKMDLAVHYWIHYCYALIQYIVTPMLGKWDLQFKPPRPKQTTAENNK